MLDTQPDTGFHPSNPCHPHVRKEHCYFAYRVQQKQFRLVRARLSVTFHRGAYRVEALRLESPRQLR